MILIRRKLFGNRENKAKTRQWRMDQGLTSSLKDPTSEAGKWVAKNENLIADNMAKGVQANRSAANTAQSVLLREARGGFENTGSRLQQHASQRGVKKVRGAKGGYSVADKLKLVQGSQHITDREHILKNQKEVIRERVNARRSQVAQSTTKPTPTPTSAVAPPAVVTTPNYIHVEPKPADLMTYNLPKQTPVVASTPPKQVGVSEILKGREIINNIPGFSQESLLGKTSPTAVTQTVTQVPMLPGNTRPTVSASVENVAKKEGENIAKKGFLARNKWGIGLATGGLALGGLAAYNHNKNK